MLIANILLGIFSVFSGLASKLGQVVPVEPRSLMITILVAMIAAVSLVILFVGVPEVVVGEE
jgi:hypothetical protein